MTQQATPSRISPEDLIALTLDPGSFRPWDRPLPRLAIEEGYAEELAAAKAKSGRDESIITGEGSIEGRRVAVAATETLNEEVFGRTGFDEADVDALIDVFGRFRAGAGDFEADGADTTTERPSA